MKSSNALCAAVWIFILYSSTTFSSSNLHVGAIFIPDNCTEDKECNNVCVNGKGLQSRCDVNGTCICDCSNQTTTMPPFNASTCGGTQPEGHYSDTCSAYCTQTYLRPFRFCVESTGKCFCTCVCHKLEPN